MDYDKEIVIKRQYIINNAEILLKIPEYNKNIKYILNNFNYLFVYTAPETIKIIFLIVEKCVEISKVNNPSEWLSEIKPFLDML